MSENEHESISWEEFVKKAIYVPVNPKNAEKPKGPNTNPYQDGPTSESMGTYSSKAKDKLWTYEEKEKENWGRWGYAGYDDPQLKLVTFDYDLYKFEDEEEKQEVLDALNEIGSRTNKSQRGGAHQFLLMDEDDLVENERGLPTVPFKLRNHVDDKINGYVLTEECEDYEKGTDLPVKIMKPEDIPDELKKSEEEETKDVEVDIDGEEETFENKHGWTLEDIRKQDDKLDVLLSKLHPTKEDYKDCSYPSRSEADLGATQKLYFWEFDDITISSILQKFRPYEKTRRNDYIKSTLKEAKSRTTETISDEVSPETYTPGDTELTEEEKEELGRKAFAMDKPSWNCETKFVTFLTDIELPNPGEIENGETYELPKELAKTVQKKNKAVEYAWRCLKCGNIIEGEKNPRFCKSCENDKKKLFDNIHPLKPYEIADTLVNNYKIATVQESVKADKGLGKMFLRQNGIFSQERCEGILRGKAHKLNPVCRTADEKESVKKLESQTDYPQRNFGIEPPKVAVKNGILNVETEELMDFEELPEDEIPTSKIPIKWDPDAECEKWEEFLEDIFENEKQITVFQEHLGTALVNEKPHKKMIIVIGPTDAGKSTGLEVLHYVFGSENVVSRGPKALADTRWARDKIFGKLLNATDEVSTGTIYNTHVLKKMADGNNIDAEEKGKPTYEFEPTCEHIFATNQTPDVERTDDAFWNRLYVLETPKSIPYGKQDKQLADKLKEEAEGILAWMVEGYQRFVENGYEFSHTQDWTEARDRWLDYGSSIQRFIKNCVVHEPDNKIASRGLYENYRSYTNILENVEVREIQELSKEVKKLAFSKHSGNLSINGERKRGFKHVGVQLPEELEEKEGQEKIAEDVKSEYWDYKDRNHDEGPTKSEIIRIVNSRYDHSKERIKPIIEDLSTGDNRLYFKPEIEEAGNGS